MKTSTLLWGLASAAVVTLFTSRARASVRTSGGRTHGRVLPLRGVRLPTRGVLSFLYQRTAKHRHQGIDLAAKQGTPIRAPDHGVVEHASNQWRDGFSGYGKHVVLRHDNGVRSLYAHMDQVRVLPGELVHLGQTLGTVGVTQFARKARTSNIKSGPHLHFEVAPRAYPMGNEARRLDPVKWLRS